MPKLTMWILPFAIIAAIIGGVFTSSQSGHASKQDYVPSHRKAMSSGRTAMTARVRMPRGTGEKHGREFPEFHNAQDYEHGAQAFITTPPAGTLTKHRDNGDTLFYDPATNTFAVADRRGEPRTFFRPNNGRAYWDRQ